MAKHDMRPLLSLVVPTKNRQKYAISLLQGVHAFESQELEVIIQDNSDEASLKEFVTGLNDHRIRYFYCAEPLTMHQNFELAIDNACGEYVCAIGDDDGIIIPAAIASMRQAKSLGADAILTEMYSYSWPGTRHRIWGDMGGPIFSRRIYPGLSEQTLDSRAELGKLFIRGSVDGLGLLPRVYQGFVSLASLTALKERSGTYFPGASPDMANAVGLVPFVGKMLFDPRITLISGHSPGSGGGQGAAGKHHGELEHVDHLPQETIRNWDPAIPRFWSGTTIYAQTVIEAARAVDLSHKYDFNYHKLCIACIIYQPTQYRKHILSALQTIGRQRKIFWPLLATEYMAMIISRVQTFVRNVGFYYLGIGKLGYFENMYDIMTRVPGAKEDR